MQGPVQPTHSLIYDGSHINIFLVNKGEGLPKHSHLYAHATYCASGSIVVRIEGGEHIRTKTDQPVNLVANEWHEIEALEDNTVFINVFAEGKY